MRKHVLPIYNKMKNILNKIKIKQSQKERK